MESLNVEEIVEQVLRTERECGEALQAHEETREHYMQKDFRFALKSLEENGTFTGLAAVYNNVDLGGDTIEPGAFAKTLADRNNEVPILYQHDSREPIGLGKLSDSREGLVVKGELVLESPVAAKAYALLKRGVLKGLSIGYDSVKSRMVDNVRRLSELKLFEISLVTFPMNESALVSGVKSEEDFAREMRAFCDLLEKCRLGFGRG
jgi:HK97 family phage prohead protease